MSEAPDPLRHLLLTGPDRDDGQPHHPAAGDVDIEFRVHPRRRPFPARYGTRFPQRRAPI